MGGQGWVQVGELLLAFVLSGLVGLERQMRRKSAGLRTQTVVGTAAALFLLVSKYGFSDVLGTDVVLDPSRVAAQVASGIGFLGAGLILTRRGAIVGLTTAASVWETAAIGMAAGAGLWLLALVVTLLHYTIVYGFTAVNRRLPGTATHAVDLVITYEDGRGLLRTVLRTVTAAGWIVHRLDPQPSGEGEASVVLDVASVHEAANLLARISSIDGVRSVAFADAELE